MFKRNIHLIFCLLLLYTKSYSQVNLQTGTPQFSLPLYSYNDVSNRLATNIVLNYNGGNGIKVPSIASSVGTGWELLCGGSITRVQEGEPDDQFQKNTFNYSLSTSKRITAAEWGDYVNYRDNYFPNGYLNSEYSPLLTVDKNGGYVPLFDYKQVYKQAPEFMTDRKQDIFVFSFGGRTGRFVIGKNNAGIKTLTVSKLQITPRTTDMSSLGIRTNISSFEIIDENGVKYVFDQIQTTEVVEYDDAYEYITELHSTYTTTRVDHVPNYFNTETGHFCPVLFKGRGTGKYVANKWYLSRIENPLTGERISFNYETIQNVDCDGNFTYQYTNKPGSANYPQIIQEKIKGTDKRLIRIDCSDNEKVYFDYSTTNRFDLPFDKSLNAIRIVYNGIEKYSWKFNYSYFVKDQVKQESNISSQESLWARLCLNSLQKNGIDNLSESKYGFDYFIDQVNIVSPRVSIFQDHWGYYNNYRYYSDGTVDHYYDDSRDPYSILSYNSFLNFLNYVSDSRAPALKEVKSGLIKSITYPAGGSIEYEYEGNTSKKLDNPSVQVAIGGVRVKNVIIHSSQSSSSNKILDYSYVNNDGSTSGWGYEEPIYSRPSWILIEPDDRVHPGQLVSGVVSAITSPERFPLFLFSYFTNLLSGYSDQTINVTNYYSTRLNANTLPFQYSRVEVTDKSLSSTIGRTIYEFTSLADYPLIFPQQSFPYSMKQRYGDGVYGLIKTITVKDKEDKTVKVVENKYTTVSAMTPDTKATEILTGDNYASKAWAAENAHFGDVWRVAPMQTDFTHIQEDLYYPIISHVFLDQTTEYLYKANGQSSAATTEFFYNADYQVSLIRKYNSKNELLETKTYYPNDYTLSGPIQTLRERNILSVPLSTQTFITKAGGKYLLSGLVNEFGSTPNGDVKVVASHLFESKLPVLESSVLFSPSNLIPNPTYYKPETAISYNSVGLPKVVITKTEQTAMIYDYENKLVTANIFNASADEVAYTSFEAENKGGWNYDPQKVRTDFAPTGKRCYPLEANSCMAATITLNTSKSYLLSFWCKGGLPALTKTSGSVTDPLYSSVGKLLKSYTNVSTGWTYYEYEITNSSNLTIDNGCLRVASGVTYPTILLDEVRLYPFNARLSSMTYEPLIGKTSECDQNGRINYYHYDGLGRLKLVKDEDQNVIKAYEYNTIN